MLGKLRHMGDNSYHTPTEMIRRDLEYGFQRPKPLFSQSQSGVFEIQQLF